LLVPPCSEVTSPRMIRWSPASIDWRTRAENAPAVPSSSGTPAGSGRQPKHCKMSARSRLGRANAALSSACPGERKLTANASESCISRSAPLALPTETAMIGGSIEIIRNAVAVNPSSSGLSSPKVDARLLAVTTVTVAAQLRPSALYASASVGKNVSIPQVLPIRALIASLGSPSAT